MTSWSKTNPAWILCNTKTISNVAWFTHFWVSLNLFRWTEIYHRGILCTAISPNSNWCYLKSMMLMVLSGASPTPWGMYCYFPDDHMLFLHEGLWSAHLYGTATGMNADCKHICELCVYSKVSESTKRQTSLRTQGASWTLTYECVTAAHDKELSASCVYFGYLFLASLNQVTLDLGDFSILNTAVHS